VTETTSFYSKFYVYPPRTVAQGLTIKRRQILANLSFIENLRHSSSRPYTDRPNDPPPYFQPNTWGTNLMSFCQ